jgi:hypothetical protein
LGSRRSDPASSAEKVSRSGGDTSRHNDVAARSDSAHQLNLEIVMLNTNYDDTATLTHITVYGSGITVCEKYTGNSTGAEPPAIGSGPDGTNCVYANSDITTQ